MKKALVTGISGQDGSYLAEFLLSKGYSVHGIVRRSSSFNTGRIDRIFDKLHLHFGDISDASNLTNIIRGIKPDEIYHLAAMSHVKVSFEEPIYTTDIGALGTLRLLEAIRKSGLPIKMYNAASSEMFGMTPPPQNENTPFRPRSPYGVAKVAAFHNCRNYRDGYGMFVSNGILFNHTSPRRGHTFVSKKITKGIANILAGKQNELLLGNLDAKRDWGFAPEYVELMWRILQLDKPVDLCIGSGESVSIQSFLDKVFKYVGFNLEKHIKIDAKYYRPTEVEFLHCENSKAKKLLNWEPRISIDDIVKIMLDYDMEEVGLLVIGEGKDIVKNKNFDWSVIK
jgi:GDPmannose 4,6-dehydratase